MTTADHYREAANALRPARPGTRRDQQDLSVAQLHALLAVADELRAIHNELIEIHSILDRDA